MLKELYQFWFKIFDIASLTQSMGKNGLYMKTD